MSATRRVAAHAEFDSALANILHGSGDGYLPTASLGLGGGETDQLALAITGGYRARMPMFTHEGTEAAQQCIYVVHVKLPPTSTTRRIELPVTYIRDLAYHRQAWSLFTEFSHGFQGNSFLSGLEYRLGAVELRGAGRYSQGNWYPSGEIGVNLTRSLAVDAGLFGTKTFLERDAHVGLAVSLRFGRRQNAPSSEAVP